MPPEFDRFYVYTGSVRIAKDVIWIEMNVHPNHPLIRISDRVDYFYGLRDGTRIRVIDPRDQIHWGDMEHFNSMFNYRNYSTWTDKELQEAVKAYDAYRSVV